MIRTVDGWTTRQPLGEWPLPGEPQFAPSRAYTILLQELQRYVREEVGGRSFLIAGHRGSGKTALVQQAIRHLRSDLLEASREPGAALGAGNRLQRPMLVKLVGQSLMAPPPEINPPGKKASKQPETDADESSAGPDDRAPPAPKEPIDAVASALVHITIALYRALAAEVSIGYAIHARFGTRPGIGERNELAAQLALDLDTAPEPGKLRRYWDQLNRLREGVMWPRLADKTLSDNLVTDQGVREIVAVATAAQAFQVCSGDVTYSLSSTESAAKAEAIQSKLDIKDLIGRVGAILAGTVAGGAAAVARSSAPVAIGIGVITWILSNATLSWSGSRSRNRQQSLSYTFLRDRSVQTLDRDLPLVIARIREAGLAPVFVIDELDKLIDPVGTIGAIISRLKSLISDYGFFCFLTDRSYFDIVERLVADQAYPNEHTYFSERLLVLNRPKDLFDYTVATFKEDDKQPDADRFSIGLFALVAVYRSKLNFTDLTREITRSTTRNGQLVLNSVSYNERPDLRLAAAIQLSCEEPLRSEPIATRFENDDSFAQLAIDALYFIPRQWEKNAEAEIAITRRALCEYLTKRIRDPNTASDESGAASHTEEARPAELDNDRNARGNVGRQAPHASPPKNLVNEADLTELLKLVERQVSFLKDFASLASAVAARPGIDPWRLSEMIPTELGVPGLLAAVGTQREHRVRFLLDEAGTVRPTAPPSQRVPSDRGASPHLPSERSATIETPGEGQSRTKDLFTHDTAKLAPGGDVDPRPPQGPALPSADTGRYQSLTAAFTRLLDETKLTVDAMVAAELLPPTLSSAAVDEARRLLLSYTPLPPELKDRAETIARLLERALEDRSELICAGLAALADLSWAAGPNARTPDDSLRLLARYVTFAVSPNFPSAARQIEAIFGTPPADLIGFALADPSGLTAFTNALHAHVATHAGTTPPALADPALLWPLWHGRLLAWFGGQRSNPFAITRDDLVSAIAGAMPGSLFRADLGALNVRDWSRVALAALPQDEVPTPALQRAPIWALFAGLRALGFDGALLARLASTLPTDLPRLDSSLFDAEAVGSIIQNAPAAEQGLVVLAPNETAPILRDDIPAGTPFLEIALDDVPRYVSAFDWLVRHEGFKGVIDG